MEKEGNVQIMSLRKLCMKKQLFRFFIPDTKLHFKLLSEIHVKLKIF